MAQHLFAHRLSLALASSAAMLATTSLAARAAEDDDIIITSRFATEQTASSVTIITAQDLERRQIGAVLDALRSAPGVTLSQNGGLGQAANVKIRGASGDQTLVLIDGAPVNDPSGLVGFDFASLDAGGVERIEILRGGGSAIWGSDAIGGVVNIITLHPGGAGASAYAEWGGYDTGRLGARATLQRGPLALSGYATAFKTKGISAADARDGNAEADGAQAASAGARAQLELGAGLSAQIGLRTTQGRADYDGFGLATGVVDDPSQAASRESLADARLVWRAPTGRWSAQGALSRSLTKRAYHASFGGAFRGERVQARMTGEAEIFPDQRALIGAEHETLEISSIDAFSALAGSSASDALFATYQGRFGARVLVEGGLRHERDERYGASTTGRLGGAFEAWDGGRLRVSAGTSYKAPTIEEVTGGCCTGANRNLTPEQAREWELGVDQTLLDARVRLGAVYFERVIDDLIVWGFQSYENQTGVTRSRGLELSARAQLGRFDLDAAFTHNETAPRATGAQVPRTPENQAFADLSWRASARLSLGAALVWNGVENDINTGAFTNVTNKAWTTFGLRAAYRLGAHGEIYGRIENALDETYQDIFGYGAPGRAAYAGVRVKM